MTYYIYKVTCKINNKSYIGYTKNFKKRMKQHKICFSNDCKVFYRAIKKYGWENFSQEILLESNEDILHLEKDYIKNYNTIIPNGYNMHIGSGCSVPKKKLDLLKRKGKDHPLYGKHHSEERKRKTSLAKKGILWSEESKINFSKNRTGSNNPMYGKTHSLEERVNISKRTRGSCNPMYGRKGVTNHLNTKKYSCKYCGIATTLGNYKRWHDIKCKRSNVND